MAFRIKLSHSKGITRLECSGDIPEHAGVLVSSGMHKFCDLPWEDEPMYIGPGGCEREPDYGKEGFYAARQLLKMWASIVKRGKIIEQESAE